MSGCERAKELCQQDVLAEGAEATSGTRLVKSSEKPLAIVWMAMRDGKVVKYLQGGGMTFVSLNGGFTYQKLDQSTPNPVDV